MSHTKGPWQFIKCYEGEIAKFRVETIERANHYWGWEVCEVNSRQVSRDPESTAKLIAASPEMFDLLKQVLVAIEIDYKDQKTESQAVNLYHEIHNILKKVEE